jgi:hypothetical protein
MSKFEFPELEGWATVAKVSDELHVSRQAVHKMLDAGIFSTDEVRQIGYGIRPLYLISTKALESLLEKRKAD